MGLLTQNDARLWRDFFKEMAYLRGQTVKYQYPISTDTTIHSEMISTLSEPIDMDIIFEENPKNATMKKLKWVSEFEDDKPYIAILPYDAPNLCTECVLTIPPIDTLNNIGRKFKITSINTINEYPDSWTCVVAPIFDTEEPKNDYTDSNYNYVNKIETTTDNNTNFSYINVNR